MRTSFTLAVALLLLVAACGGADDGGQADPSEMSSDAGGEQSEGDGGGEGVVNQQPPGQAVVSLQGETYTLDTVGPAGCNVEGSEFDVSFLMGDNEVNLIGGGDASESTFNFNLTIQGDDGTALYAADSLRGESGTLAVDDDSVSYVGSISEIVGDERVAIGEVTISATCS